MSSKIEITINNTSNDFQTFSVRQSAIGGDTNPLTCSDQMYPYIGVPLTITDFSVAPNPGSPKISVYTYHNCAQKEGCSLKRSSYALQIERYTKESFLFSKTRSGSNP